jgi:hypothetical protein
MDHRITIITIFSITVVQLNARLSHIFFNLKFKFFPNKNLVDHEWSVDQSMGTTAIESSCVKVEGNASCLY